MYLLSITALPVLVTILCVVIYRNGWTTARNSRTSYSTGTEVDSNWDDQSATWKPNDSGDIDDINPATGLLVCGGVDTEGNPYGAKL